MKISALNSTLSCIIKCIRFLNMITNKKIILGLFVFSFLGACSSPTAMLGPAYTLSSSGNVFQAGLNYGSNQMITMYTGPNIAVGVVQAPKKLITNNPKIIFLVIIIVVNLIHFVIQLKVELKTLIFISNLTKFKGSK